MSKKISCPFNLEPDIEAEDNQLIERVLSGDKNALEGLLIRHQPWIYNIAFRMVLKHEDAEDVTQEILIKIITKLSSFKPEKAAFRTWLYRIVVNHVINMKTRSYESSIPSLENYYSYLHLVPDEEPDNTPEMKMVITDLGIGCTEGVLLCLDRKQRVVFILAVVFNVTDAQGSEILEISKANYRKILSRARAKLHQYMDSNCSIINQNSRCKCRNKVKGFIKSGALSPDVITFNQVGSPKIKDVIWQKATRFQENIYSQYMKVYQDHPFYKAPDITEWFRNLLESAEFKQIFQLD